MVDTQRVGRHRQESRERRATLFSRNRRRKAMSLAVIGVAMALVASFVLYRAWKPVQPRHSATQHNGYALPVRPSSYIGLYAPKSNSQVKEFTAGTGIRPRLLVYYSGWPQPFRMGFATTAAQEGAVPLVQMNPTDIRHLRHRRWAIRRLPEHLRNDRPRLPPSGHPELRARDERLLVLLGLHAYVSGHVRSCMAAHSHSLPEAGSPECDLAVDGQHHPPAHRSSFSRALVARQLVRELGRDRRLLYSTRPRCSLQCSDRPSSPSVR